MKTIFNDETEHKYATLSNLDASFIDGIGNIHSLNK